MERAACKPDPSWSDEQRRAHVRVFFPERGDNPDAGLKFCRKCPVRLECDSYADKDNNVGMWGGSYRTREGKTPYQEEYVKPKSLSASSIQVYLQCPARWKAEYLNYGRMPGNPAASLGTACHTALEAWVVDGHYQRGYPNPRDVIKALYDEGYWREFSDGSRYDEGLDLVYKWLDRQDWTGRTVLTAETKESFEIPTTEGPVKINYVMDRLDSLENGDVEVVDYKTLFAPLHPLVLKQKPQARIYALAAQLRHPEANRIWVTFDMLRYEPIGIVFSKEENRATWRWLCEIVQRIIDDEVAEERLNKDCRYCIRKSECDALGRHVDQGGPLSLTDPGAVVARRFQVESQMKGLEAHLAEIDDMLLDYMKQADLIETELEGHTVKVTISGRRSIDDDRLRAVIGEELMGRFGAMTIGKLDAMMKSDELTPDQKKEVKALIRRDYGDPKIVVDTISPF